MYYLYVDESGDHDDYFGPNGDVTSNRTKYFTLGGIIFDERSKSDFEFYHSYLIDKYFSGFELPTNFKIHYHELRYKKHFPYNQIVDKCEFLKDLCFELEISLFKFQSFTKFGLAICVKLEIAKNKFWI